MSVRENRHSRGSKKKKLYSDGYMTAKTRGDTCPMSNFEQAVQLGKRKIKQIRSSSFDAGSMIAHARYKKDLFCMEIVHVVASRLSWTGFDSRWSR